MYFILEIFTPNKLLMHKGRTIRTPAKFIITEKEIKMFKVMLHQAGVEEYTIRFKNEIDVDKSALPEHIIPIDEVIEEVVIEILDDENETKSILDQLIKDAKEE